jgi:MGT family glycosyltransferase
LTSSIRDVLKTATTSTTAHPEEQSGYDSMNILITCPVMTGHLNPLLSVGRILITEGHVVLFLTGSAVRDRVEEIGAVFRRFPPEIDQDLRDLDAAFPERKTLPAAQRVSFDMKRIFTDPVPTQHKWIQQVLRDFPADVIIADPLFFGLYPMLLGPRSERPAIITCGITFLPWHRDDGAPPALGLAPAQNEAERERYAAVARDVEADFAPVVRYLNDCLAGLGVRSLPTNFFDAMVVLPDAFLQFTVPSFEFPRKDLPDAVHFVGGLPITPNQASIPPWAAELNGTRRVVLVTQGTLSNHDFGQLIVPTLVALAAEPDIIVVVTGGGRLIDSLPSLIPCNARSATYLPFEWLLPKVDVIVTNGGYGSVNQALTFGIPIVAAGQTEDKADISARVAWSGVGIDLKTSEPTPSAIREAVRAVLDEPTYRARATSIAKQFARIDTRSEIVSIVNQVAYSSAKAPA